MLQFGITTEPHFTTKKVAINYNQKSYSNKIKCLHKQCPSCKGSGKRLDGLGYCIHNLSCPCKKCSVMY